MPNYGDPQYWDDRYENAGKGASFDWLENYSTLQGVLAPYLVSN